MPDWVAGGDAASDSFFPNCDDDVKPDTVTAGDTVTIAASNPDAASGLACLKPSDCVDMTPDAGTAGDAASPSVSECSELSDWDEVIPNTVADADSDSDLTALIVDVSYHWPYLFMINADVY